MKKNQFQENECLVTEGKNDYVKKNFKKIKIKERKKKKHTDFTKET